MNINYQKKLLCIDLCNNAYKMSVVKCFIISYYKTSLMRKLLSRLGQKFKIKVKLQHCLTDYEENWNIYDCLLFF